MSKITRKFMKIFGQNAGAEQIEEFGSLAAGSPVYTSDPEAIQSLSNYLSGWFAGVVGSNAPAIEDLNALCFLYAYQLSYLMQAGVAEWNTATIYYTGSLVSSAGQIYVSLTDTNVANAVTDSAFWKLFSASIKQIVLPSAQGTPSIFVAPPGVKSVNVRVVKSIPTIVANSVNSQTLMSLRSDGQMVVWGNNTGGLLGDGTLIGKSSPVLVAQNGVVYKQFFASSQAISPATFAMDRNNILYAWGGQNGTFGDCGVASLTTLSSPTLVALSGIKIKRLWNFTGDNAPVAFAQSTAGDIYGWGHLSNAGSTPVGLSVSSPTVVGGPSPGAGLAFTQMFADSSNGAAWGLLNDGTCYSWGQVSANVTGYLGQGNVSGTSTPNLILGATKYSCIFPTTTVQPAGVLPSPYMGARHATSGISSVFLLDTSNNLWACGDNGAGALGIGSNPSIVAAVSSPTLVVGAHTYQGVYSYGADVNYFLTTSGQLYGVGVNSSFQLGQGQNTTVAYSSPVLIAGATTFSQRIQVTFDGTVLAFDTAGNMWGWGLNSTGLLLKPGGVAGSTPSIIVAAGTYNQIVIGVTQNSIFALDKNGNIFSWGGNNAGVLGNGTPATPASSPTLVVGGNTWAEIVDTSDGAAYALDTSGAMWAWGRNIPGQLGVGNNVARSSPTLVVGSQQYFAPSETEIQITKAVVPGQSYPVIMGSMGSFFNGVQVADGAMPGQGHIAIEFNE